MMKKVFALLVALMMVLGMGAASAQEAETPATTSAVQVLNGYYTSPNGTFSNTTVTDSVVYNHATYQDVKVSKTVTGTNTENVFDITLNVETKQEIEEVQEDPAAAVVLVLDVSGSMSDSSVTDMVKGANAFLNAFAGNSQGGARKAAVVSYGGTVNLLKPWGNAKGDLTYDGMKRNSGTNTHGAMVIAQKLLEMSSYDGVASSNVDYKYVVLMTDGEPNRVFSTNTINNINVSTQTSWPGTSDFQDNDAYTDTADVASAIEGLGAEVYALGYDLNNSTASDWLSDDIATDASHYFVASTNGLVTQFQAIINAIGIRSSAWMVTDPVGDGLVLDAASIEDDPGAGIGDDGEILWNLRQANMTQRTEGGVTFYSYAMTYRVALDTLDADFAENTWYKTNGVTSLTYFIEDADGNFIDDSHEIIKNPTEANVIKTMYFNVPAVEGYKADLTFKKINDANSPVANAEFTVVLTGEDGKSWSKTSTSAENGIVTIEDIPSGHSYKLVETFTPEKHETASDVAFDVSYGTIDYKNFEKLDNSPVVVNTRTEGDATITVTKKFSGVDDESLLPASVPVTIINKDNAEISYEISLLKDKDYTKTVTVFAPGTYTVQEGTIPAITGHSLASTTYSEEQEVTVAIDGSASVEITNTYTRDTGSLVIEKVVSGTTPTAITFTITGPADYDGVKTITYPTNFTDGKYTISNAPTGEYTVTESGADVAGYTLSASSNPADGKVNVTKAGAVEIAFKNDYTQKKGELVIAKKFDGLNDAQLAALMDRDTVAFEVKSTKLEAADAAAVSETVKLSAFTYNKETGVYSYTMPEKLPVGAYTVSETGDATVDNFDAPVVSPASAEVTVTAEGTASVTATITNTYTRKDAQSISFDLTKVLRQPGDVAPGFDDFQFELKASIAPAQTNALRAAPALNDNEVSVVGSDNVTVTKKAEGVYTLSINDVPVGKTGKSGSVTVYANADEIGRLVMSLKEIIPDLSENEEEQNAWSFDETIYTYKNGEWSADKLKFENTYTKNLADLIITKTIKGITSEDAAWPKANEYKFVVTNSDKVEVTEVYLPTEKGELTVTVPNLAPDTYTVTEVYSEDNWPDYYEVVITDADPVSLNYYDIISVTVTNEYKRTEADILAVSVNKIVDDSDSDVPAPAEEKVFSFTGKLFYANANNGIMLTSANLVDPGKAEIIVGSDTFSGNLEDGIDFNFTITTKGSGTYTAPITVKVNAEDRGGLMLTIAEVDDNDSPYWYYNAEAQTLELEDGVVFDFVNTYLERSYEGLRIPFSKTVVQTGTADPGTNTFYIEYDAWRGEGIPVDVEICNDPLNKYGKVEVVENQWGMKMIAITVNGANTVNGYIEVSGKDSELPEYIYMSEANGLNWELTEEALAADSWAYDITAFPYKYEEMDGEMVGWMHAWTAYFGTNEDGERTIRISRSDDYDTEKDKVTFVNTYSADEELPPPPQTGDNSHIALWIALMGASALCFVVLSKRRSA